MATVVLAVRSGLLMEQLTSPVALDLDAVMALMSRALGLPDQPEPEPPSPPPPGPTAIHRRG
jgi:hypothetical protein